MNDDDKSPKKAFNENAPKPTIIRDQDNADKEYTPPNNESHPRPNAAPRGMSGINTGGQQAGDTDFEIELLPEKSNMVWHEIIDGNYDHSENLKGYSFELTLLNEANQKGLEDSNIKQLDLKKDGLIVSRFDEGQWQHESHLPKAREIIEHLKEKFPVPKKEFKSFNDMNPDDGNDIDL